MSATADEKVEILAGFLIDANHCPINRSKLAAIHDDLKNYIEQVGGYEGVEEQYLAVLQAIAEKARPLARLEEIAGITVTGVNA